MERLNRILGFVLAVAMLLSMASIGRPAALAAEDATMTALTLDVPAEAVISEGGQMAYFTFTPEETGVYMFSADTTTDTRGYLYDENMNELASDDDSGEGLNFMLSNELMAGTTYIFGARYYDTGVSGGFTVLLTKSPVVKVEVKPLSIMEGTCGMMETIWNGDGEIAGEYYYYFWQDYVQYTLTFDDGTVVEATGSSFEYNGIWYSPTYQSEQNGDNQWTAGNTYTAQLSVMGVTADVSVTITASPVESITFAPISVADGLDGEWRTDYNSETGSYDLRWYHYNWISKLRYTIVFTNGSTLEGTSSEFEYNGEWYSISVNDDQSSENPWKPGNSYKASATVLGKRVELTVEVTDSPVASVSVEPISLVEDTNGYWMTEDVDGGTTTYYHYMWWDRLNYSVTFKDGSTLQGWGHSFTYNGENYYITISDPQCSTEPWTVGNTYTTSVGIMGVHTDVSVTIASSLIADITFDPISIEEGTDCSRWSEWNPETEVNDRIYYHYDWAEHLSYTITFTDGTVMKAQGTSFVYDGESYSLRWNDGQCYDNQWMAGGTYTVTVSTMGTDADVSITITPTTIQSIVFEPVSVIKDFDGSIEYEWNEQTQKTDREYFRYYWWNNLRYTITYTNGTTKEAQGASFIHNGKEVHWEWKDTQCADSAWEIGNTYTVTVSAVGKEYAVDVSVIDSPVVSVEVTPIEILSGTNGYLAADYIDGSDSYSPEYFRYDWIDKLEMTVIYADGTVRQENGGLFRYNDSWYSVDYSNDQNYENRWLQGNTYTETISILGYEAEVKVTITASPVASISVEPIAIVEQTGGYFTNFWNPETGGFDLQVYVYKWWDKIHYTVTFADGTSYRGSGLEFLYDGQWYSIEFMDDQSDENPWSVGTHTATIVTMGVSAPVSVTIMETPVQSITLDPITVQKGVDDYWHHGNDYRSHYYRWYDKLSGTVTFNDGSTAKLDSLSLTYQGEQYDAGYEDGQSGEFSWAVGGEYTVSITLMGVTAETTVTVIDTDVQSVVMKPVVMAENCEGHWNTYFGEEDEAEYFCYDWWNAMEYTVTFKDGTTVNGFGPDFKYNGEWYHINSFDNQPYNNPLTAGNTYTMDVDVAGYETEVTVQIVTPKSDSGYKYLILDGKACIVGCTRTDKVLTVPAALGGYEVARLRGLGDALTTVEELVLPDTVTRLSSDLFRESETSVRKVTLGSGMTSLEASMFTWVDSLEEIDVSENNPAYCSVDGVLYDKAVTTMVVFPKAHQSTHVIPDSVKDVSLIFDNLAEYAGIAIQTGAGTPQYVTVDEVIYTADMKTVLLCSGAKTGSYVMPESVTTIKPTAFSHCALTSVTVSSNVKELLYPVFYECFDLETVLLPEGLETIGHSAFLSCTALKSVTIPASVRYVGGAAFAWCESLDSIIFLGDAPEFDDDVFYGITTQCYYPADNATWTDEVLYGCSVEVTWIPYGADVTAPTLAGKGFSLSYESEILVNFYYSVSDMASVVEHGMLVFNTKPETVSYSGADAVYSDPVYSTASAGYGVSTDGIAAKEMGDARHYAAYAKLVDGTVVYSKAYEYSPKKYAVNLLGRATTSDKQKALCVAMLNYGAAAQNFFGYKTEDLMNAGLTDEQKALVKAYDASYFAGTVPVDASKIGSFAATGTGFSSMNASVSFEGAFAINYYFAPSAAVAGDMKLYVWTPEAYAAASELTSDNASAVVSMAQQPNGAYWGQASDIAAKMMDETYYVAGVYTDANGNTYCTGVIAYSLSKYCMNNAKPGKAMRELASATAMYGYYAKAYFS